MDLTEIIIVGDLPSWFNGTHIYCEDVPKRKEFSIYTKLMKVQDVVGYGNDDMYPLKDFDSTLPNYYSGTCRQRSVIVKDKKYKDLYANCLPEWMNYDIHTPMIIDTTKFVWDIDRPIKTYYANQNKLPGEHLIDCKISGSYTYNEIKALIKSRPFFSTKDNADKPGMAKLLQELYPNPSQYER